jgi:hypothetical protein
VPVIFRYDGFKFFFFSNEANPREPTHVHVLKGSASAKFWLTPEIRVARSDGFEPKTLRQLGKVIEDNKELIERTWNDYFR